MGAVAGVCAGGRSARAAKKQRMKKKGGGARLGRSLPTFTFRAAPTAFLSLALAPFVRAPLLVSDSAPPHTHASTMRPFLLKGHSRPLTQLK